MKIETVKLFRTYTILSVIVVTTHLFYTQISVNAEGEMDGSSSFGILAHPDDLGENQVDLYKPNPKLLVTYITTNSSTKGSMLYYVGGDVEPNSNSFKHFWQKKEYVRITQTIAVHREYSCLSIEDGRYVVYTLDNERFEVAAPYIVNIHHAIRHNCEDFQDN